MNKLDLMGKKIALFPGSFDPFHRGHKYVVDSALKVFDIVVICVAVNPSKEGYFDIEARKRIIETTYKDNEKVIVMSTEGLVIEKALELGATMIVKGARSGTDFDYEVAQSDANYAMGKIGTFIIPTSNEVSYISSSLIRSLLKSKGDAKYVKHLMC